MSPDDPLDDVCESISDDRPVDWSLAETESDAGQDAQVRAFHDLERIARYNRSLQRSPVAGRSAGVPAPEQWGHLTLLELASAGQSGEIWRAWDSWLQREVALKFLMYQEGDPDGSALLGEARALARVRHPGVVAVYGLGEHEGRLGMWMELLVGRTLEEEIERRGRLDSRDVAKIGVELCRALEAVVAAGLVHRDIKPANIIRESSGRVVLTDFGLGRRRALAPREALTSSGTPLFMSPELHAGEPATPRSDLYALGATLRWALTGRCPFRARTFEELQAEVAKGPSAPLASERPDAPTILVEAIERAMAPRAEDRYASAGQMAEDLEKVLTGPDVPAGRSPWQWIVPGVAALVLLVAAVVLFSRAADRSGSAHAARFSVSAPPGTTLSTGPEAVAVSPDGQYLAIAAEDSAGVRHLWLRPLASLEARLLPGTDDAVGPFWSPDSRNVAFFADRKVKKVSIAGGLPEELCPAPDPRGGAWGKDGVIIFVPVAAGALCRVSAEGGPVTEILRPDSTRQETALRWPQFLPDGKHFLFVALPPRDGNFDVYVASTGSNARRLVMTAGCAPICAGNQGFVVSSNGRLMFQKFDYRRLRPMGRPIALGVAPAQDVSVGQPLASASMNGVLAWLSQRLMNTQVAWVDRSGKRLGVLSLPEGRYERLYVAPDGDRLLAERRDSPTAVDLWMVELARGGARRFTQTSQSRIGGTPAWSPDGSRIAFSSNRGGRTNIYQRLVNEAGEERLLYQSNQQFKEVTAWSPDGKYLVFEQADPVTGWDLWLLPLDGKREPIPYLRTRGSEYGASVSPDGRWLCYTTDITGKTEVYVRSFPKPGVEYLAFREPARGVWARAGTELLATTRDRWTWSVPVTTAPSFQAGEPHRLFRISSSDALSLTPMPDGDRFLECVPEGKAEEATITIDLDFLGGIGW